MLNFYIEVLKSPVPLVLKGCTNMKSKQNCKEIPIQAGKQHAVSVPPIRILQIAVDEKALHLRGMLNSDSQCSDSMVKDVILQLRLNQVIGK